MSRNNAGEYSLPAGNPVAASTVISSTWANPTMEDIGNEITNSLDRNGRGGMLVPFQNVDGLVSAPGITFTAEPGSGLYRAGSNDIRMSVGGDDTTRWRDDNAPPAGEQRPFQIWNGEAWQAPAVEGGSPTFDTLTVTGGIFGSGGAFSAVVDGEYQIIGSLTGGMSIRASGSSSLYEWRDGAGDTQMRIMADGTLDIQVGANADLGPSSTGTARVAGILTDGIRLWGKGSVNDLVLGNKAGLDVLWIPNDTVNVEMAGDVIINEIIKASGAISIESGFATLRISSGDEIGNYIAPSDDELTDLGTPLKRWQAAHIGGNGIFCDGNVIMDGGDLTIVNGRIRLENVNDPTFPVYSFNGDGDTGMYRPGADTIGFTTGGVLAVEIDGSGNVEIARGGLLVTVPNSHPTPALTLTGLSNAGNFPVTLEIRDNETTSSWVAGELGSTNLDFYNADASGVGIGVKGRIGLAPVDAIGTSFDLVFQTSPVTAGTLVTALTIDSQGISTFAQNVTVNGSFNATSNISANGSITSGSGNNARMLVTRTADGEVLNIRRTGATNNPGMFVDVDEALKTVTMNIGGSSSTVLFSLTSNGVPAINIDGSANVSMPNGDLTVDDGDLNVNTSISNDPALVLTHSHVSSPLGMNIVFSAGSPNDSAQYFINCFDTTETKFRVNSNGEIRSSFLAGIGTRNVVVDANGNMSAP